MSIIPSGLDSPDFVQNQGAGAAVVFNRADPVAAFFTTPRVYVGGWQTLYFLCKINPVASSPYQVTVNYFADAVTVNPFATVTFDMHVLNIWSQVVFPCYGPYVSLTYTRLTGVATDTLNVYCVAGPLSSPSPAGGAGKPLITFANTGLPGAGTVSFDPVAISNGVATMSIMSTTKTWYALLQALDATGVPGYLIASLEPGNVRAGTIQFGLPPVRCRLVVVNTAAPADLIYGSLAVNWQT